MKIQANFWRSLVYTRLHYEDGQDGEYAILVRSGLKGLGLGWFLMTRLVEYARAIGLREIHGLVLPENTAMLKMCGEFGFKVADDAEERGVKRVTLALGYPRNPPRLGK